MTEASHASHSLPPSKKHEKKVKEFDYTSDGWTEKALIFKKMK